MHDDFDKNVVNVLKNIAGVTPSKNIGEAAIESVTKRKENDIMMKSKSFQRILAISVCTLVVAFCGVMAFSEEARNAASNMVLSIFAVEKNGDSYEVVQKDAANEIGADNFGNMPIDQMSRDELINKLGFEPFVPEKIGPYSKSNGIMCVTLRGALSEITALNKDEVEQSIQDDAKLESLKKYHATRYLQIQFSKGGKSTDPTQFILGMSPKTEEGIRRMGRKLEKVSEFSYKGVKCTLEDDIRPNYQLTTYKKTAESTWMYDDNTKQPNGIIRLKHITFELGDVLYSVSYQKDNHYDFSKLEDPNKINDSDLGIGEFDYNDVEQFVKDFIDAYNS